MSILIVHWNTREDLAACLRSLEQYPFTGGEHETIVVDNASTDGSPEMVRAEFPGVRLIVNATNENYARGTNQALEAATGDLLLLLNPDIEVLPDALDCLCAALLRHPAWGAVAAKLIDPPPSPTAPYSVQSSVRGFPEPAAVLYDILGLARLFPRSRRFAAYRMPYFHYGMETSAPQPMASCFLITRQAYQTAGPMDERFPLYFNDVDWCLRFWNAGFEIGYTPDAVVIHKGGGTTRRVRKAALWESRRAWLRFNEKHYRQKTSRWLFALLTALLTLDAWRQTGRWGQSLGKHGGETTTEQFRNELQKQ